MIFYFLFFSLAQRYFLWDVFLKKFGAVSKNGYYYSMKTEQTHLSEMVFGIHPILELVKAKRRRILTVYTLDNQSPLVSMIKRQWPRVEINRCDRARLNHLADNTDHQGIVALATPFEFRKKPFEATRQKFLLMLDGIQDPRNLGAILRSAYCTGVQGVIITTKHSSPINAVCLKASAGLAEHLEIQQVPAASAGVQELKKAGYTLYIAALAKGAVSATAPDYHLPLCVVIGSEGKGVSPDLIKQGTVIKLPQKTADISYNASVAAGILLFLISTKNNLL